MRCMYCHNPDTWDIHIGQEMTVEELVEDVTRYAPYQKYSGGGVTVTGGEPMLQATFVADLFEACQARGIHTALDTSGFPFTHERHKFVDIERLVSATNLVLLDIKHIDDGKHHFITEHSNHSILEFAKYLSDRRIPVWIRHVLVSNVTDSEEDLRRLSQFIHTLKNVEKVEVLPYHELGVHKWTFLGLPYRLEGVHAPTIESVTMAKQILGAR